MDARSVLSSIGDGGMCDRDGREAPSPRWRNLARAGNHGLQPIVAADKQELGGRKDGT